MSIVGKGNLERPDRCRAQNVVMGRPISAYGSWGSVVADRRERGERIPCRLAATAAAVTKPAGAAMAGSSEICAEEHWAGSQRTAVFDDAPSLRGPQANPRRKGRGISARWPLCTLTRMLGTLSTVEPCVRPVLVVQLYGYLQHGGGRRLRVRGAGRRWQETRT